MNSNNLDIYENTRYSNNRNKKQILILDVDDSITGHTHLGSGTEFSVDLFEPLIIDKHSEVYLDNFITYNSNLTNQSDNSAFVLKINEFNMNSNVASSNNNNTIFNSLVIPNEHNNPSNNQSTIIHKSKKFNYICDINPSKIRRITGKITNLAGGPIFHGASTNAVFTYSLTGIKTMSAVSDTDMFPLLSAEYNLDSDTITQIVVSGTTYNLSTGTSNILAHTQSGASTIHFSSNVDLDISKFHSPTSTNVDITITYRTSNRTSANGVLRIVSASNPSLQLIKSDGRFIAEFSINSRE